MDKNFKKLLLLVSFGVVLFAALFNFTAVINYAGKVLSIFLPIIVGLIIAFVLNVPMKGFDNLLHKIFKKNDFKHKEKLINILSLVLTLLAIIVVIVLAVTLAVPEIVSSVKRIYVQIQAKLPEFIAWLNSYNIDTTRLTELAKNININSFLSTITTGAGSLLSSVWGFATTTVSGVSTTIFAIVISIYVLLDKKTLSRHMKKLMYSFLKTETTEKLCEVGALSVETYSKFLSGQTIEAVILGVLIFIFFSIFRLPYAALIAFLTSFFAFVPYVGAFASCAIGAFLILLDSPEKVITCVIVYLVVQFVENQFIYPHVVGSSVGLSPLWTLMAAIIGGNLFGIVGIIFFIPLAAVLYTLLQGHINKKLRINRIKID
ncbi:MAG: AI-2E family transporter [Clostridia bacterium]|nr:AI-2E family transporter [Clostridia bacterium]